MSYEIRYCKYCGCQLDNETEICPNCGKRQIKLSDYKEKSKQKEQPKEKVKYVYVEKEYEPSKYKNKWITFVLCFFFGLVGAHKFYENKIGIGILYIATMGLFGFGWIVDLIIILTRPHYYMPNKKQG